ncbi:hypothetical protein [uncultured Duncaniella sp.]|jgi:hypothetical protein|uniref:hypothetical protein n=1 Tax=uncultured Duncaniella sp. TaxID=2768039 RepID=UPI0025B6E459|nr:hypothetical protein [uncultured Duncaniella sp.]
MNDRTMALTVPFLRGWMGDVMTGTSSCKDMDTCLTPGSYIVTNNTANIPEGIYKFGLLIVSKAETSYPVVCQMYIPDNVHPILIRMVWAENVRVWRKIAVETI